MVRKLQLVTAACNVCGGETGDNGNFNICVDDEGNMVGNQLGFVDGDPENQGLKSCH